MTVRLHLIVPALTPGARHGLVGAGDGLARDGKDAVLRCAHPWPVELKATCAPEPACVETASLLGLHATVDPGLHDWNLGAWAGRSLTQIAATSPQDLEEWMTDPDFTGHGGESLQRLRARAADWLDQRETAGDPRLVAVASVAVVRAILLSIMDAPATTFWRLDLEPVSSIHVSLQPGRRAVRWPRPTGTR